jgi:mannosylglycerate hydrolase
LGHKIAKRFGHVSKTGYSPFSWGQISQMPQIYNGSRLVASRLAVRPRYNIWYVVQRPGYWNQQNENNRVMSWKDGHGPFRFVDEAHSGLDMQYVHPRFDYFKKNIEARAQQAYDEQDGDWTTQHRFWSCGHDSSCPDIREMQMIADCDKAIGDKADVFHSSFEDFQKGVCESASPDLPLVKGEMRHYYTKGSTSVLFGWIISARMDLKKDNFITERALTNYAEPLAVFASLLGTSYPQGFVDTAYKRPMSGRPPIDSILRLSPHKPGRRRMAQNLYPNLSLRLTPIRCRSVRSSEVRAVMAGLSDCVIRLKEPLPAQ